MTMRVLTDGFSRAHVVQETGILDKVSRGFDIIDTKDTNGTNYRCGELRGCIRYFVAEGAKERGERPARVLPRRGGGIQLIGKASKQFVRGYQAVIERLRRKTSEESRKGYEV